MKTTRWERLRAFFLAEEVPYGLALCRIILGLTLFFGMVHRWPYARELYTTDGSPTPIWVAYGHDPFFAIPSPAVGVALYALLLGSLITSAIGWNTRLSLGLSTGLLAGFGMLDMIGTMTKHTVISVHALLLLTLSCSGDVWSVDSWLKQRRSPGLWSPPMSPAWPRRLIQILVGIVYLGAAATKMHTPGYFSGDQLAYWMLTNVNFANPLGEYLSQFPAMLVVMSYVTIFWEIAFPFVCWKGTSRTIALALGLFFHAMTIFTLGLIIFPLVYIALYACFWDQEDYVAWRRWERRAAWRGAWRHAWLRALVPIKRLVPTRWGAPHSLAAWGVLISALCVVAIPVEHRQDLYGERRPAGRYQLQPISEERLAELLRQDSRIRVVDKVFGFDVGTKTFDSTLINQQSEFTYGEKAIVQCSLSPAHEDCWVEVYLEDADGRIMHRTGSTIPRESLRGFHQFEFGEELVPGNYMFSMRMEGETIARRPVKLVKAK